MHPKPAGNRLQKTGILDPCLKKLHLIKMLIPFSSVPLIICMSNTLWPIHPSSSKALVHATMDHLKMQSVVSLFFLLLMYFVKDISCRIFMQYLDYSSPNIPCNRFILYFPNVHFVNPLNMR